MSMLIILVLLVDICLGFTITIVASREKCFHQVVSEGQKLFGSYAVQFGGRLDINIKIADPDNAVVFEEPLKQSGSFEFIALKNGRYELCLNNKRVSVSTKRISFSFHVSNEIKKAGLHISKHFGSLETAINNVAIGIHSIQDHHHYIQIRDKFSRQTNESTLLRVTWMCVLEIVVIICLGAFQIFYINQLFNRKR